MKLSQKTIDIFKNFATIHPSILIYEGKVQKIVTPLKTAIAVAELDEEFPRDFGVYDLNTFCSILSTLNDPVLDFEDDYVQITSGETTIKYWYSDSTNLKNIKEKVFELPSVDVQFRLEYDVMASMQKLASLLKLTHMIIEGDGENMYVSAINPDIGNNGSKSNKVRHNVGQTDKTFQFYVKFDNLKMLPDNYDVKVSKQKIIQFDSTNNKLSYWAPCEKQSTFES